jgi:asparagine synthase (glutamine-hydrolysing)
MFVAIEVIATGCGQEARDELPRSQDVWLSRCGMSPAAPSVSVAGRALRIGTGAMFAAMAGETGCQASEIAAMAAALRGRGGDDSSLWLDESGAFAAASRLAILLPEDAFDTQPFTDHELVFVCRARLDDRAGLLQQLQIDSAHGATLSDAGILRQCYKKWREETPRHVYGDYAFVAWERWSRRTVAATDHLGNFRLFYGRAAGRILFASQLGALLACPALHPGLDLKSLGLMAAGRPAPDRTMYEGIRVLSGGELLIHQDEMVRVERWWRPDSSPREVHAQVRDYVEEARALFDSAVASRLRARGGVVATLSGGLDSTLVAVTAARQMAVSGKVLEAFTAISQPGLPVDEPPGVDNEDAPWAAAVADFQPNLRQRLVSPVGLTPLDVLPLVHSLSHTPVMNPVDLVWRWQMSARAAHNRSRVILCGDHGNRSISYVGDLSDANFIRLRRIAGAAQLTWDRVKCIGTQPHAGRFRASGETLAADLGAANEALARQLREELDAQQPQSGRELFTRAMTSPQSPARADFMAQFGLEWLDPTGDRKLLERLLSFPLHVFRVGNRPRGLARELGRGLIPDSVRLRRARSVQFPDQTAWFALRSGDYHNLLQSIRNSSACAFFLDIPSLESLLSRLCAAQGTPAQAMIAHRALDAGLFAMAFEASHGLASGRELQGSQEVPTLSGIAAPPLEPATRAHA